MRYINFRIFNNDRSIYMRLSDIGITRLIWTGVFVLTTVAAAGNFAFAQGTASDADIAKNRKGELVVRAKRGDKITVEQLSHEFWFGCAISNSLAGGGRWSEADLQNYKDHFLKN